MFIDVELLLTGYRTSGLGVSADFRFPCPGENMMKMMILPGSGLHFLLDVLIS